MTSIACAYVQYPDRMAMGATARSDGLLDGLAEWGFDISRTPVRPAQGWRSRLPELWAGPTLPPDFVRSANDSDIILLIGLPLAYAARRSARRLKKPVHVDVCDSWISLSSIGAGSSRHLRFLKRAAAQHGLRTCSRTAGSVSYITRNDAALDSAWLVGPHIEIVPNASHFIGSSRPTLDPSGPFVVMGDYAYPPNKSMLDESVEWASAQNLPPGSLRVVGANVPVGLPPVVDRVGWVDELSEAFEGACALLAPVRTGAGVNNKVLDGLALGVPVLATPQAAGGIPPSPLLAQFETLPPVDEVRRVCAASLNAAPTASSVDWKANTAGLAAYLHARSTK